MDVRAVLLVGGRNHESTQAPEILCGAPVGLLDVLGAPVVERVLARLEHFGVTDACIVTEAEPDLSATRSAIRPSITRSAIRPSIKWLHGSGERFWRCAETAFSDFAQAGAELVILVRIGPYAEIDYEEFIQNHLDSGNRVTRVVDPDGRPLDTLVVSASRRNDAAFLLRHELNQFRSPCNEYKFSGYLNWLESSRDFRKLALDSFARVVSFSPVGTEIKPGVWVGERVSIHKTARVLAPAFIGTGSRIRALSVITRASIVEHHCEVDCGSVVEASNLLPFSYVGPGLDVAHSVVGSRHIAHLVRNVEVEIFEPKFIRQTKSSASARAVSSAISLATFIPRQFARGVLRKPRTAPSTLPEAISNPSPALKSSTKESPVPEHGRDLADLAVARRYGNE